MKAIWLKGHDAAAISQKGLFYKAADVDAYRERVRALVEAGKSLLSLCECLLGDGITRGTEPIEIIKMKAAIAALGEDS